MVMLVGGYLLTFAEVAHYADVNDIPFADSTLAAISVRRWFRDKKITIPEFMAVQWGPNKQTCIMFATRMRDDNPRFQFTEQERDKMYKGRLLQYPGLEGAEMRFATVANPYGNGR